MKKLLFISMLILSLLGNLNAQEEADVLSLITNGALSKDTQGVKVLSPDEKKKL